MTLNNGRDVFRFLIKNPKAIPLASSPSSAYFLLSLENFLEAWRDWLLYAIQSAGYDVSTPFSPGTGRSFPPDQSFRLHLSTKLEC